MPCSGPRSLSSPVPHVPLHSVLHSPLAFPPPPLPLSHAPSPAVLVNRGWVPAEWRNDLSQVSGSTSQGSSWAATHAACGFPAAPSQHCLQRTDHCCRTSAACRCRGGLQQSHRLHMACTMPCCAWLSHAVLPRHLAMPDHAWPAAKLRSAAAQHATHRQLHQARHATPRHIRLHCRTPLHSMPRHAMLHYTAMPHQHHGVPRLPHQAAPNPRL